jgi:hypothetical protein
MLAAGVARVADLDPPDPGFPLPPGRLGIRQLPKEGVSRLWVAYRSKGM